MSSISPVMHEIEKGQMGSTSIVNRRRQKVDIFCPEVLYVLSEAVDSETRSALCVYCIVYQVHVCS